MGCAASTAVPNQILTSSRPQEPARDLTISEHALVSEEDASSTFSDARKYYLSSSSSRSSTSSGAVFSEAEDLPHNEKDVAISSTVDVERQRPNSRGKCVNIESVAGKDAAEKDMIDFPDEATALGEGSPLYVVNTKLSFQPSSEDIQKDHALSEATSDLEGKSLGSPNQTNKVNGPAAKYSKPGASSVGAATGVTKSKTGIVTVGCCESAKWPLEEKGAPKPDSASQKEASDCSGTKVKADRPETTTGEGDTKGDKFEKMAYLTSPSSIADCEAEMLEHGDNPLMQMVSPTTKHVVPHTLRATKHVVAHALRAKAERESLLREKTTKELGEVPGICSSTCSKIINIKDKAERLERCRMEQEQRKSAILAISSKRQESSSSFEFCETLIDEESKFGSKENMPESVAKQAKVAEVAGSHKKVQQQDSASAARHISHSAQSTINPKVVHEAGLEYPRKKTLSGRSFIAEGASESDTEESDEDDVPVKDVNNRGTQTKTSGPNYSEKERSNLPGHTRRIQSEVSPANSNQAQSSTMATTMVSPDGGHRLDSSCIAPRLERNLSNELKLLSRRSALGKREGGTDSESAKIDNSITLHNVCDGLAVSDNYYVQTTGNDKWKGQRRDDNTNNKRLKKSMSGLTERKTFHSVDVPSHGSTTVGNTLEIPSNEESSTTMSLIDTGVESDSSSDEVFKKLKKKRSRDLKTTRKDVESKSLDKSLASQMKSKGSSKITKPSDASISRELDNEKDSCNEHRTISRSNVDSDGNCSKSTKTSKPGAAKTKPSKNSREKPNKEQSASLGQFSESRDLPDWRARAAHRSGVFGIAGSICSTSKIDTSLSDAFPKKSVSQRSIEIFRDPKTKKLSRQGLMNEEDVTEESREYAKNLKDEALSKGYPMSEFFDLLNLDPWQNNDNKLDEEKITKIIRKNPHYCGETYNFESFHCKILPLAALCALGATLSTIEECFHAFETAGMMIDNTVGTPLHYACAYNASLEVVKYLVKTQPAALKERNQSERLPLHMACLFGASYDVISFLVENYSQSCRKQDRDGMTPLHLLCNLVDTNPSIVRLVADREPRACLKPSTQDGSTPIHLAIARKAPVSTLRALIRANDTALSTKDEKGRIPLFVAVASRSDIETFQLLLLKHPASRTTRNKLNELPVTMAARMNLNGDLLDLLKPI